MTQIITAITHDYILLASDRRLTDEKGRLYDDDTCKLVSFCNVCGIGYTGLAQIDGFRTDEWIARVLVAAKCRSADLATRTIANKAAEAFNKNPIAKLSSRLRRQLFIMAGWKYIDGQNGLRPFIFLIGNAIDVEANWLGRAHDNFKGLMRSLNDDGEVYLHSTPPLSPDRERNLYRNMHRLVSRKIGPKEALRLFVDEIIQTSTKDSRIGDKILGLCIPKASAESTISTGSSFLIAQQPNLVGTTFTYFDPSYSELQQYGPTFVCGESASTDFKTESDPARDYQSSEVRIISLPGTKK